MIRKLRDMFKVIQLNISESGLAPTSPDTLTRTFCITISLHEGWGVGKREKEKMYQLAIAV